MAIASTMIPDIEKQIAEIEETQEALRESIEHSKQLAAKTEELLKQHRDTLADRSAD